MGVARHDDVDALHGLGQLVVLSLAAAGAAVGEADHHGVDAVLSLAFSHTGCHSSLGGLNGILHDHARVGRAIVGVKAKDTEQDIVHTAPLQNDVFLHAIVGEGIPHGLGVALLPLLGGPVVGIDNGGDRITAVGGGVQHTDETALEIVVLMVAKGSGIIAHGPHHPQLDGGGRVGGLEQGAHGEVPAIHQNSVGILGLLLLDGGHEACVTAVLPAPRLVGRGEKMGMEVVGEEDGDLVLDGLGGAGDDAEGEEGDQDHGQGEEALDGSHGGFLSWWVCVGMYRMITQWNS